jgi:hypothetical protein
MPISLIAGRSIRQQQSVDQQNESVKATHNKSPNNKPVHQGGVKGGTQLFTISEEAGDIDNAEMNNQH